MTYVVLNPTWTVPFSIATEEMLPVIREEPGYFVARSFDVFDAEGRIVDPDTVDWRQIDQSNFNYTFVQRPGPGNTLGRVKFMFPNVHSVSLHDTPNKSLFDVSRRALSHGCVRIEHPLELAELVLADAGYSRERIDTVLESGKTTNVSLAEPLPVLLVYWTADVQGDGKLSFYEDIYGHDEALARALDTPILLESP
jgi:murein L,D-transpeptidase YcbB/YkuD